ncbi:MAG: hypothetical protein JRN66_07115 [Nitrososphaerota archaeon]|nr:hypothetical protein [Nitrososphaerota archaeon]
MRPDGEILDDADLERVRSWKARYNHNNMVPLHTSSGERAAFLARIEEADKAVDVWCGFLEARSYQVGEFDADMREVSVKKVHKLPDGYIATGGRFVAFCEFKCVRPMNFGIGEEYYLGYRDIRRATQELLFILFYCPETAEMWACNIDDYKSTEVRTIPNGKLRRYAYFKHKIPPDALMTTLKALLI